MNWRKIDDVEGLSNGSWALCARIIKTDYGLEFWDFKTGYFEHSEIYLISDTSAKDVDFTHYCIITPPEE